MNHSIQTRFERWLNAENMAEELRSELQEMLTDSERIVEAFSSSLTFGTAGLRGVIGAGTNRMNMYTIRKATVGLAQWLKESAGQRNEPFQVAIAYDCRHFSTQFAEQAALTLAHEGIKVYVYPALRSTPQLSFTVRQLQADAGIMITASHNPPEYNGYKVYGADGAQLLPDAAQRIMTHMNRVEDELNIPVMEKEKAIQGGYLVILDERLDERYADYVATLACNQELLKRTDELRILFTPLHGTAYEPFQQIMKRSGFTDVHYVEAQCAPDPDFSTVLSPNPEEHAAFELAVEQAKTIEADLVMGTDPDADRMGMVIRDSNGEYRALTGNQIGVLLLHYLISQKNEQGQLHPNDRICKSIVTSDMGKVVAAAYGVQTEETLTGFKYIAELMKRTEEAGRQSIIFGYEESYGYLFGDQVRDKDALQACLLAAEMTLFYKLQGRTVDLVLEELYETYGHFLEELLSFTFPGLQGMEKMGTLMHVFREEPPLHIANMAVEAIEDYRSGKRVDVRSGATESISLPSADVIKLIMAEGSWCCIRPSGTEPKLKIYLSVKAATRQEAEKRLEAMKRFMANFVQERM